MTLSEKIDDFLINENPDVPMHMFKSTIEGWRDEAMSGGFNTAITTLTNAQILTLPSTPVELIPAPGAGKIIMPILSIGVWHVEADYVMDVGSRWQLYNGDQENSGFVNPNIAPGAFFDHFLSFAPFFGLDTIEKYLVLSAFNAVSEYADKPLNITDNYNGVPNYTGGDGDNYLKMIVNYSVLDVLA